MTTIGNIGVGLFIIIILWILALAVFVIGVKLQSNISWVALITAAIITLVLVSIPTKKLENQNQLFEEKDYSQLYYNILLIFLILSTIFGFVTYFIFHCIEPVRIKPIKKFYIEN